MKSIRGLKTLRDQDKVFSIKRLRTRMTSIEILSALFKITSDKVGTRLDLDLKTSKSFIA